MFIYLKLNIFATVVYVAIAPQSIMLLLGLKNYIKIRGEETALKN
jgi:hypothetical protein